MEPAVFLDRDNTLIANDGDLGNPDLVRLLDGVPTGLKALRGAGYRLVVVTNQGGVARGRFTESDVDAVHRRIAQLVDTATRTPRVIERFYYCPYHPEGEVEEYRRDHPWRKPRAGMLRQAAVDLGLDLSKSWMIGDQPRDLMAGEAAGCKTVLLALGTNPPSSKSSNVEPTAKVMTFPDAVQEILRRTPGPRQPEVSTSPAPPASRIPRRRSEQSVPPGPTGGTSAAPASPVDPAPDATPPRDQTAPKIDELRRAVLDLTDEIRTQRLRGAEFTGMRVAACIGQMLAVILALAGLLQLDETDVFVKWMLGAGLLQMLSIALLLLDLKG